MDLSLILLTVFAGTGMVVMTPLLIVRMILKHREKLIAMKYRQEGAPGLIEEMTALRRELSQLRETTGKFDMSFDAALCRLEERVEKIEGDRRGQVAGTSEEPGTLLRRS